MTPQPIISSEDAPPVAPPPPPESLLRVAWRRIYSNWVSMTCVCIVGLYVLAGLAALTPTMDRLITQPVGGVYDAPRWGSPSVWLGTDIQGQSVFWRTIYGARVALVLVVITSILSLGIGTILGTVAGYFGGWIDVLIVWLFTTISSIPWLLLVLALAYVLSSRPALAERFDGLPVIIIALGLTDWVGLCRLLRGEVLKHRERDYVVSARAAGAGDGRIIFRHILPNVAHLIIITFSLSAVSYVQAEVVLTFVGLGISGKPSWGRMIDDARLELLRGVWWQIAAATIAIFVLCLALNILGDDLRDALDPRLRNVS
ncbi:MAG TPA: ABC transporter permease [Tepidisphaeraceae bacterium]|nr:ABC transporter permease [Tepidisphaeraceae bacterium]